MLWCVWCKAKWVIWNLLLFHSSDGIHGDVVLKKTTTSVWSMLSIMACDAQAIRSFPQNIVGSRKEWFCQDKESRDSYTQDLRHPDLGCPKYGLVKLHITAAELNWNFAHVMTGVPLCCGEFYLTEFFTIRKCFLCTCYILVKQCLSLRRWM